ncbi:hypothetical protein QJS10_CPA01g01938 [Acorus calamus]|uniref:Response regulatory domain-containing protein n=1 Tax=Acorus calamus TaxID=4465 RepID=A0AAV9FKZ3_ACOCL|nr:hypothetical protein QJS10_CPA01g01938 [Acorus calamus]
METETWKPSLVIKSTLRGRNHTVEESQNCEDAIKYFVEDKKCDLVFVAKNLPKMDGLQTIRSLKDIGVDIPIIASSLTEDEKELFMTAGATEFIAEDNSFSQPVFIFDVLRIVNKYLLGEQPGHEIE